MPVAPRKSTASKVAKVTIGAGVTVDVDLDALRKARADGKRTKTFRFGGEVYQVAGKMPVYVAVLLGEGEIRQALQLWLGDEAEQRFQATAADLSQGELQELMRELYRVAPGESDASGDI